MGHGMWTMVRGHGMVNGRGHGRPWWARAMGRRGHGRRAIQGGEPCKGWAME